MSEDSKQFVVINGDTDIDYFDCYGPYDSRAEAEAAIVDFPDGEEYGENMVRVIPLLTPEKLQRVIDEDAD